MSHRNCDDDEPLLVGVGGRQDERKRRVPVVNEAGEVKRTGSAVSLLSCGGCDSSEFSMMSMSSSSFCIELRGMSIGAVSPPL